MTTTPGTGQGAKERAQETAGTAVEEGKHVAGAAGEEARNVAAEAAEQARGLLDQALGEVSSQSRAQQERLAGTLRTLGDDLEQMAGEGSGLATDLAREVATRARRLGDQLQNRQPSELLDDVRGFARRRPGSFLLGALTAGVVVGRLARGAADGIAAAGASPSGGGVTGSGTSSGEASGSGMSGTGGIAVGPVGGTTDPPRPTTPPGQSTVAPPLDEGARVDGPEAGYGRRAGLADPSGDRGTS